MSHHCFLSHPFRAQINSPTKCFYSIKPSHGFHVALVVFNDSRRLFINLEKKKKILKGK